MSWVAERLLVLIPLVLSLTVHEFAHAWSAHLLGDDTARLNGRLTLDPLPHLDPVGTFILPLIGVPFGWAVPVPVNPGRFRLSVNPFLGLALVAAAGPLSNFLLAGLAWGLAQVVVDGAIGALAHTLVGMNLALGLFNLLPIPPMDGSRIVDYLLPDALRGPWATFARGGALLLLIGALVFWMVFQVYESLDTVPPI